jgi:hypothetical protein
VCRNEHEFAVLLFASVEQVELYYPLSLPIALQLGGFLMLAYGFAPGRIELGQPRRKKGNRKTKRTRKSNADYHQHYPSTSANQAIAIVVPPPTGWQRGATAGVK